MARRAKDWKKSEKVKKREEQLKKKEEYVMKRNARFYDSLHKYEKFAGLAHGHSTEKEIKNLDMREDPQTYVERHYFVIICVFTLGTASAASLLLLLI